MATPKSDPGWSIYQIKITLGDVDPPIWRRVEIADCPLEMLHRVVQDAMGWENYHLYEFRIDDAAYSDPRAVDEDNRSAAEMTLGQLVGRKCMQFDYVYDFGGTDTHIRIVLEGRTVPIRERSPGIPVRLAEAIDRATEPDPEKRYQRAEDFLRVLELAV